MFINHNYSEEPLLFICAKNKNYFMLEFLLRNNVDINTRFRNEYVLTLLIKNSCQSDFVKKLIINHNANINICDSENNHFIFLLIKYKYFNILYYICQNKNNEINLNMNDKDQNPLLLAIIDSNLIDLALYLINLGTNINCFNNRGDPLIFKLIKDKKINISNILIDTNKVNLKCKNKFTNMSLFELLVQENIYTLVKKLLEITDFIIPNTIISEYSLIEIAARNNNTLILHKLILYECSTMIQKMFRAYIVRKHIF